MTHKYIYKALSMKILTVASINLDCGDFSVYIDVVGGTSFDDEYMKVVQWGTKLDERIAKILYPTLFEKYRWRD